MSWPRSLVFWALVSLSLATLGLGLWLWQSDRQKVAAQSQPAAQAARLAPDFTLPTADGGQVRLAELRGKVVLLNFWATWCPPCKAEMPDLNALHQEHGRARNFVVLGINNEEAQHEVEAFARRNGILFPLALDLDGAVTAGRYGVRGLPTSMIVDREGNIRDSWMGQLSREAMVARLKRVW
jgi:peroxiredoxin